MMERPFINNEKVATSFSSPRLFHHSSPFSVRFGDWNQCYQGRLIYKMESTREQRPRRARFAVTIFRLLLLLVFTFLSHRRGLDRTDGWYIYYSFSSFYCNANGDSAAIAVPDLHLYPQRLRLHLLVQ